jgi:hypothetical protein
MNLRNQFEKFFQLQVLAQDGAKRNNVVIQILFGLIGRHGLDLRPRAMEYHPPQGAYLTVYR